MEISEHHVEQLIFFLDGVSENDRGKFLKKQAFNFSKRRVLETGQPAYPNLQTREGQEEYARIGEEMYEAILSGNYTKISGNGVDDKCRACGNLGEDGCGLKGKTVSRR